MSSGKRVGIFLLVVVAFVLFLTLIFKGGSSKNPTKDATKKTFSLTDYVSRDSKVVAITDGPITGDDTHRAVRVTIDRDSRTIDVIQGYQGTVIDTRTYPNNQQAYDEFMHALARTGYGKERKVTIASEDGVCAQGRRYVFQLFDGNNSVSRTWTANCLKGSSIADPDVVTNLFRRQITDYDKITAHLNY